MKNNWEMKTLREVCAVVGGGTPKTGVAEYWSDDVVWVTPKDLGQLQTVEIFNTAKKISKKGLEKSSAKLLPVGSVVMSSRAPIGYVAIAGVDLATNQGCRNFICGDKIYNKYLYYFLFANTELLNRLGGGATFKEISGTVLKSITIPIPTLAEQKRIVGVLDEKFGAIEELKRVTELQIKDAQELFESRLNEVFSKDNTELSLLGNHIDFLSGPAFKSEKYTNENDGVLLLRGDNILNKSFRWDGAKRWSYSDLASYQKYLLSAGDVVLAMDRPFVGYGLKHNLVTKTDLPLLLVQRVARLRPRKELKSNFLMHLVSSKKFIEYLLAGQTGVSVPHISKKQIEMYQFSLPSISEQNKIAKELDELSEKTKGLQAIFRRKIADLEELKKSYLEQAFAGKL